MTENRPFDGDPIDWAPGRHMPSTVAVEVVSNAVYAKGDTIGVGKTDELVAALDVLANREGIKHAVPPITFAGLIGLTGATAAAASVDWAGFVAAVEAL